LTEVLLPADGVGELQLLWPTLARLSQPKDGVIALIAPPYRPYPPAWDAAGVRLGALQVIQTKTARDALWATEQCLRSGACSAVLCWPQQADDRALRRLQVAAETGQALGFAFRPMKAALNPSPAALRIALDAVPRQLRVLKCRGGTPPTLPIPFPHHGHPERSSCHPERSEGPVFRLVAMENRSLASLGMTASCGDESARRPVAAAAGPTNVSSKLGIAEA
jgi:cell division inhibitor SulA